jgi:imidazolonepropionase-like amidohydrolase/Tol biopolymer transport system component
MIPFVLALSAFAADPKGPPVDPAAAPARVASFTATEGTWMNVDVSPDGKTVVFDLLGHLYLVPIGGGPARALTTGHSWNMHPRFSPDGSKVAFTSDRGGGDNVWVVPVAGGDPMAVTDETFRLVSQPEWTPDGRFLVGRKHFTGTRSLGTGEIWAFHVSGQGDGHAWTEKGHLEADVNEPALDPTGRYLYGSQAGAFDYNRNVYEGIYSVFRKDLRTGEQVTFVSGPGGASRPQVSPDGKVLGYVRRRLDGQKTELVLRDLASGRERVLYADLDRDQQETWSIHGTFPAWSWMPDGSGVVASSRGGLWRIGLDGKATAIPFQAPVSRPLAPVVRQKHALAPTSFASKAIRWPSLAADGRRLLFVAVGRVWIRDGEAPPVALSPATRLAYAPAFSPDGRAMVYTTWSDAEGGMVWLQRLEGAKAVGEPVALGDGPDLYTGPAFDTAGKRVAWLRGEGATNRGSSDGRLRLQWREVAGGPVVDAGTLSNLAWGDRTPRPRFSPDGERLWVTDQEGDDLALVSVSLSGHDRQILAKGGLATEIHPSPDGAWIAWKAQHRAYLAPMPPTGGRPVVLGTGDGALPAVRLSHHLGEWIAWADADTLTWAAGPTVYRVELADGLPVAPTTPPSKKTAKNPWPDGTRAPIGAPITAGLTVDRAVPDATIALVGARIIPIEGEVIADGTVVVRGERIVAVGPRATTPVPAGAKVLDLAGKTVMPGLVDVHAHMGYGWADVSPELIPAYAANLAYGVTTTHDPSAQTHFVFAQRELVESGRVIGPRILSTGFILYGAENDEKAVVESLDDAREHLRRLAAYGAISVKSYNQPRRDQRQWILKAAAETGLVVVPEGGSTLQHNLTMIVDGHTGIEHALPVEQLYDDVRTLWAAQPGTHYTPTLLVGYGGLWGENAFYQRHDVWTKTRLQRWTRPGVLEARGKRRPSMAPPDEWQHVRLATTAWALAQRGVRVNLGAHGQLQGLGPHWELWALGEGGFPALEALRAATLNGAAYLGVDADIGSLVPGKLADLVVLDADPLVDLRNTEQVHAVMKGGVLYDPDTLATRWPVEAPGPKPWWHAARTEGGPTLPWRGDAGDGCMHDHP